MSLFWVMFWKALVVGVYVELKEAWEARRLPAPDDVDGGLLLKQGSSGGATEQSLALPDLFTKRANDNGTFTQ